MKNDKIGSCPVKVGERLVVLGRPEKVVVKDVLWIPEEVRWKIILDWGEYGTSHVWSTDEKKVWNRFSDLN